MNVVVWVKLWSMSALYFSIGAILEGLTLVSTSGCGCLGETLIYECTLVGGPSGATLWTGTALNNCPSDEIVLLHRRFTEPGGTTRSCSNGATAAQSLYVRQSLYTSRLIVTITPNTAGKTITCTYDAMGDPTVNIKSLFSTHISGTLHLLICCINIIFNSSPANYIAHSSKVYDTIIIILLSNPGLFPSTKNVRISIANFNRKLLFNWSPAAPDCPTIYYNILASNCGSCPTTTNYTNVTCTDAPISSNACEFVVHTVVCGNITGYTVSIGANILYPREDSGDSVTVTAYIKTAGSFVTALIVGAVVSITVVVIILKRSKAKIKAALELSNVAEGTIRNDPMYEDVTGSLPPDNVINTQDNVAYGHTKTSTLKESQH